MTSAIIHSVKEEEEEAEGKGFGKPTTGVRGVVEVVIMASEREREVGSATSHPNELRTHYIKEDDFLPCSCKARSVIEDQESPVQC